MNYKMNVASRLIDSDGGTVSLIDIFDRINSMPMEFIQNDLLLEKNGSHLYRLDDEQRLVYIDRSHAVLKGDGIAIAWGSNREFIPVEEIRALSVEQNHKLTVNTAEKTLQLNLEGGSALQWQIYINRLKNGEKPVKSI
jgi:hypothetical protein